MAGKHRIPPNPRNSTDSTWFVCERCQQRCGRAHTIVKSQLLCQLSYAPCSGWLGLLAGIVLNLRTLLREKRRSARRKSVWRLIIHSNLPARNAATRRRSTRGDILLHNFDDPLGFRHPGGFRARSLFVLPPHFARCHFPAGRLAHAFTNGNSQTRRAAPA